MKCDHFSDRWTFESCGFIGSVFLFLVGAGVWKTFSSSVESESIGDGVTSRSVVLVLHLFLQLVERGRLVRLGLVWECFLKTLPQSSVAGALSCPRHPFVLPFGMSSPFILLHSLHLSCTTDLDNYTYYGLFRFFLYFSWLWCVHLPCLS